jgi:hypothetical protein
LISTAIASITSVFLIRPLLPVSFLLLLGRHPSFLTAFLAATGGVESSYEDVADEASDFYVSGEVLSVAF